MKTLLIEYSETKITKEKFEGFIEKEKLSKPSLLIRESDKEWYATFFNEKFFFRPELSGLISLISKAKSFRKNGFEKAYVVQSHHDYEVMPVRSAMVLFMLGFFLKSSGIANVHYLDSDFKTSAITYQKSLAWGLLFWIKLFFAPFILILKSPYTFYQRVLKEFLLAKDHGKDEIIGYGPYLKFSGHVYFKIRMKMINRVGLFGIMSNDYLGVPLTLHRSPLDGFLSAKLGYRAYIVLSVILMSLGFSWIIIDSGKYELFLLLPLIFTSTYFIKTMFHGHLESMAWGFFCLSVVSFVYGYLWLSALFFGLLVLTHIGIALLNMVVILTLYGYALFMDFTFTNFSTITNDLILFSMIVLAMTLFVIVPFIRSRDKLGRNKLINEYYEWAGKWNFISLSEAITYCGFLAFAFYLIPIYELHFVLVIPLVALFINSKVKWLWSAYTIELCMLTTGTIFILLNPNLLLAFVFLFFIFTSPVVFFNGFHGVTATDIPIQPIRLGNTRDKIMTLFSEVPGNARVAFEGGPMNKTRMIYDYNSHLSLLLLDEKFEMMNAYAPEFVDACIYTDIVYHLYHESSKEVVEKAMRAGGAGYILVYDTKFKTNLRNFGYEELGSADCTEWTQFGEPGPVLTLFKAPFPSSMIEPTAEMTKKPNEISFEPKAGATYTLRYGHYIGWRAYQNGVLLPLEDIHPGMRLKVLKEGTVTLRFQYRNFLR